MLPLTLANIGEENVIKKIGGNPAMKKHLENLGLTVNSDITVLSKSGGSVICLVKEGRLALDSGLVTKIFVS